MSFWVNHAVDEFIYPCYVSLAFGVSRCTQINTSASRYIDITYSVTGGEKFDTVDY